MLVSRAPAGRISVVYLASGVEVHMTSLRVQASFDPQQRYKILLTSPRLVAQVEANLLQPNLVQLGQLVLIMVYTEDGSEWWAFCCPVCDANARPQTVEYLEVFDLVQPQATEIGRTWFDLVKACAEVYSERWRQSAPVSNLEFNRAKGHVEHLADSAEKFMALIAPSHLADTQWIRLEHLLLQAKEALYAHYNALNKGTNYSMLHLEWALWCLHETVDLLGARLGLRAAA